MIQKIIKKPQKIVVLMGGNSSEREISLISGKAILKALKKSSVECFGFDWHKNNLAKLYTYKFDKVFIALHGKGGEDGFIQHQLEKKNISYTGTNAKNSKNCIDKNITKQICKKNNLAVAKWIIINKEKKIPEIKINLPWAIKPNLEGSSVGISKVNTKKELKIALNKAFKYDDEVIVEEWITGKEYTVAIVGKQIMPVIEIIVKNGFYDYYAKYQSKETDYICPAQISVELMEKLQKMAKKTFTTMGMKDWGRVDFIKDKNDNLYLLEVNTVPGMTSHSLVPMAAKALGLSFEKLVINIING